MADVLDLITLAEAKAALNVTAAGQDAEVEQLITAVSRRIDGLCGPVVQRTVADETHFAKSPTVWLNQRPVASVTTVTEWSSGVGTVLTVETPATAGDYLLDGKAGVLTRRSSWADTDWGSYVTVTYVAGRYASTATVDARFKQAAAVMVKHLWKSEQGAGTVTFGDGVILPTVPSFAVPNLVLELLADETLPRPVIA